MTPTKRNLYWAMNQAKTVRDATRELAFFLNQSGVAPAGSDVQLELINLMGAMSSIINRITQEYFLPDILEAEKRKGQPSLSFLGGDESDTNQ